MLKLKNVDWKKTGIFAAGVLFGTAGIKALSSDDAKNVYTNCTAAVLRAKSCVMKTAAVIQENAEDIYAGAKQINEEREAAAEAAVVADAEAEEAAETTDEHRRGGYSSVLSGHTGFCNFGKNTAQYSEHRDLLYGGSAAGADGSSELPL